MDDDIVTVLRDGSYLGQDLDRAADEIERLRDENSRLKQALDWVGEDEAVGVQMARERFGLLTASERGGG